MKFLLHLVFVSIMGGLGVSLTIRERNVSILSGLN